MSSAPPSLPEVLYSKNKDELNVIAKKLRIPGYRRLTKDLLTIKLLQYNEDALKKALNITWWDNHNNHVYGVIGVLGTLLSIVFYCAPEPQRERSLREIDKAHRELLNAYYEFGGGVDTAADWAAFLAQADPKIQGLADTLRGLVIRHKNAFQDGSKQPPDIRIRLADATIMLIDRRFSDALSLITLEDEISQNAITNTQIDRNIKVNLLRADSFFGLGEWSNAVTRYQRVLALQPDHRYASFRLSTCLLNLHQYDTALKNFDTLYLSYESELENPSVPKDSLSLAEILNNRGVANDALGFYEQAVVDYKNSLKVFSRLRRPNSQIEQERAIGAVLNNLGNTFLHLGKAGEAIDYLGQAITLRARIVTMATTSDQADVFKDELANSYVNRGNVWAKKQNYKEADRDHDEAVRIYTTLTGQTAKAAKGFAAALQARATTSYILGRRTDAIRYLELANEIRTNLTIAGHNEVAPDLVTSSNYLGQAYRETGEIDKAIESHANALKLITTPEMARFFTNREKDLAWSVSGLAAALCLSGRLEEAIGHYTQAIAIYERLNSSGQPLFVMERADVLTNRAIALRRSGKLAEADNDLQDAVGVYSSLIAVGRKELNANLGALLNNRSELRRDQRNYKAATEDAYAALELAKMLVCEGPSQHAGELYVGCIETLIKFANEGVVEADAATICGNAQQFIHDLIDSRGRRDLSECLNDVVAKCAG